MQTKRALSLLSVAININGIRMRTEIADRPPRRDDETAIPFEFYAPVPCANETLLILHGRSIENDTDCSLKSGRRTRNSFVPIRRDRETRLFALRIRFSHTKKYAPVLNYIRDR